MNRAIATGLGLSAAGLMALLFAPAGQATVPGVLLRTAGATAILILFIRIVGVAAHRRPPQPAISGAIALGALTTAIIVAATSFLGPASGAACWFGALFAAGVLLNRVCDVAERHAIVFATVCVTAASIANVAVYQIAAISGRDASAIEGVTALWRNVARLASQPVDAAWVWLAWRVADRLRTPEARRPLAKGVTRPSTPPRSV